MHLRTQQRKLWHLKLETFDFILLLVLLAIARVNCTLILASNIVHKGPEGYIQQVPFSLEQRDTQTINYQLPDWAVTSIYNSLNVWTFTDNNYYRHSRRSYKNITNIGKTIKISVVSLAHFGYNKKRRKRKAPHIKNASISKEPYQHFELFLFIFSFFVYNKTYQVVSLFDFCTFRNRCHTFQVILVDASIVKHCARLLVYIARAVTVELTRRRLHWLLLLPCTTFFRFT